MKKALLLCPIGLLFTTFLSVARTVESGFGMSVTEVRHQTPYQLDKPDIPEADAGNTTNSLVP